ncbi:hypothetical protein V8D89_001776 [Ganoderma adspersum]
MRPLHTSHLCYRTFALFMHKVILCCAASPAHVAVTYPYVVDTLVFLSRFFIPHPRPHHDLLIPPRPHPPPRPRYNLSFVDICSTCTTDRVPPSHARPSSGEPPPLPLLLRIVGVCFPRTRT